MTPHSAPGDARIDGLVYAVDVPRFFDSNGDGIGDLRGVIAKLDYIASLGTEWLWLLPVYASPRLDNGYDVSDHRMVDPALGTLEDLREVIAGAHRRGIRVMLELVAQHTSDQHRWFREARRNGDDPHRSFYIWSDTPPDEPNELFPGEESSVWAYDDRARSWYRHTFYRSEPDLNLASPGVRTQLEHVVTFLRELGADALRVDAGTLLLESAPAGQQPDEHAVFRALHGGGNKRGPALIAEVDRPVPDKADFLSPGRYDGVFGFSITNALWLSLATRNPTMLATAVNELQRFMDPRAVVTFARNVDELDLEQLTADERHLVYAAFAPDESMRIYGRGIRRGWAPMLGAERFQMTLSLLLALPTAPALFHGQELGVGDDLSATGREGVRLAMQWSAARNGGFTTAETSAFVRPAQHNGPHRYTEVNAAQQEDDPVSPLALVRSATDLRRRLYSDRGQVRVRAHGEVLCIESDELVVLHNFCDESVAIADSGAPLIRRGWKPGWLEADGFAWLGNGASTHASPITTC